MKRVNPPMFRSVLAQASIWTLIHHDFLAGRVRIYVWAASATVLFLSIAGIISLRTALHVLLFGGLGILILLWAMIHWRKGILLDIRDEKLRQTAHAAMLALIHARQEGSAALKHPQASFYRWLKKKRPS